MEVSYWRFTWQVQCLWWIGISLLIRDCKFHRQCFVQQIHQGHCHPTLTHLLIAQTVNLSQWSKWEPKYSIWHLTQWEWDNESKNSLSESESESMSGGGRISNDNNNTASASMLLLMLPPLLPPLPTPLPLPPLTLLPPALTPTPPPLPMMPLMPLPLPTLMPSPPLQLLPPLLALPTQLLSPVRGKEMSMSDSCTLFDPSQREVRDRSMSDKSKSPKDQHYPLERNERMGCTVDSVGSAGEGTSCFYILCCIMDWHRRTPCCWQQLCFFVTEIDLSRNWLAVSWKQLLARQ